MQIKASIDRFENQKAVLKTEQGDSIIIPKNILPDEIYEGMILYINIEANKKEENKKEKQAKEILNEILNIDE